MDRIKQILGSEISQSSVNTDTFVKTNLVGSERLLPTNDINAVVNVAERFNIERQACSYYRIIGNINLLVSNPLFNITDEPMRNQYTWGGFNELIFLDRSYPYDGDVSDDGDLTYTKSVKTFLKEKEGWFGYYDPNTAKRSLCQYYDMEPKRERFTILPDMKPYYAGTATTFVKNWELTITYPDSIYSSHTMTNGGLLIVDIVPVVFSTKEVVAFGVSCLHNLVAGDTVEISGSGMYDGRHTIIRVGLDNGDYKGYYFVIDMPSTGSISVNSRFRKIINNVPCEYYFRKFRKIKTKSSPVIETDDYEVYQPGFAQNLFNDDISQFVFNEDIDVSDLTDNLGRPLSELYLTIIKTDSNNLFGTVSSGIESPFINRLKESDSFKYLKDIPVINRIHNGGLLPFETHTPLESSVLINQTEFFGDLVEYSVTELRETVLADVQHRFNTLNRETVASINSVVGPQTSFRFNFNKPQTKILSLGPRQEGYYYKAHHKIKIRDFSSYIEEGDASTADLPSYAVNLNDVYIWRELVDIGFNETNEKPLNYPFLNGVHYLYDNISFNVKRQDPFDIWGLYYGQFPADPLGKTITDKYKFNSEDSDVC